MTEEDKWHKQIIQFPKPAKKVVLHYENTGNKAEVWWTD